MSHSHYHWDQDYCLQNCKGNCQYKKLNLDEKIQLLKPRFPWVCHTSIGIFMFQASMGDVFRVRQLRSRKYGIERNGELILVDYGTKEETFKRAGSEIIFEFFKLKYLTLARFLPRELVLSILSNYIGI